MRDRVRSHRRQWLLGAVAIVSLGVVCAGCGAKGANLVAAVAAYFRPRSNYVGDSGAQRKTVADMRQVGTAMFSWVTDQVGAAAAGQQPVDLAKFPPVSSFAALKQLLVPKYIQALPERDGWGNPFEYRLNLKNPTAGVSVMSVRSPGRDGKFSGLTYAVEAYPRDDYDRDIVWADGYFVQWPQ